MFPNNGRVLGIQVDNSYISLPGELFENLNESGFLKMHAMTSVCTLILSFQNLSHLSTLKTFLI